MNLSTLGKLFTKDITLVLEHGIGKFSLLPYIEQKFADMSWLHNRPTMPTFLPPQPTKEEITTIDIEACFQEYRTLRGDINERYSFQEYLVKYGFRNKKENLNSLKKNHPTCEKSKYLFCCINEEVINTSTDIMWNVWKKFRSKKYEKSIYDPLHRETENHEVDLELPQGDCRK